MCNTAGGSLQHHLPVQIIAHTLTLYGPTVPNFPLTYHKLPPRTTLSRKHTWLPACSFPIPARGQTSGVCGTITPSHAVVLNPLLRCTGYRSCSEGITKRPSTLVAARFLLTLCISVTVYRTAFFIRHKSWLRRTPVSARDQYLVHLSRSSFQCLGCIVEMGLGCMPA